ncbi:MAG: acetyl-CoA carboxylase biotin carboxyl carrier protein [Usitatibacter sp.]
MKRPAEPRKRRAAAGHRSASSVPAAETRAPTYEDLLAIVRLIESGSRFTDFRLRSGDIEVEVHRSNGPAAPPPPSAPSPAPAARESAATVANAPSYSPAANQAAVSTADLPAGTHVVRSPMVGTFFRAPEPGAAPFVKEGARVKPNDIVCIIEVMKLMNSVTAGAKGVVTHVFVENAQTVEPGQPLIAIRSE